MTASPSRYSYNNHSRLSLSPVCQRPRNEPSADFIFLSSHSELKANEQRICLSLPANLYSNVQIYELLAQINIIINPLRCKSTLLRLSARPLRSRLPRRKSRRKCTHQRFHLRPGIKLFKVERLQSPPPIAECINSASVRRARRLHRTRNRRLFSCTIYVSCLRLCEICASFIS